MVPAAWIPNTESSFWSYALKREVLKALLSVIMSNLDYYICM